MTATTQPQRVSLAFTSRFVLYGEAQPYESEDIATVYWGHSCGPGGVIYRSVQPARAEKVAGLEPTPRERCTNHSEER